jgi:hypothetical protein
METPQLMRDFPSRDKVNYHGEKHLGPLGWSISTSVFFFPVMQSDQFGYTLQLLNSLAGFSFFLSFFVKWS